MLFAPGLPDLAGVRAVCSAVSKPVNFMVGIKGKSFTVAELAAAGVRRINLATSLYRAAMTESHRHYPEPTARCDDSLQAEVLCGSVFSHLAIRLVLPTADSKLSTRP